MMAGHQCHALHHQPDRPLQWTTFVTSVVDTVGTTTNKPSRQIQGLLVFFR